MSSSNLQFRCLASTGRNAQRWQGKQPNEADGVHDEQESDAQRASRSAEDDQDRETASNDRGDPLDDSHGLPISPSPSDQDNDANGGNGSASPHGSYHSNTSTKQSMTRKHPHTSCVQEAQLSPDGTCILTSDYNRSFSVYPIDANIFTEDSTRTLEPYAQFTSADPIWSFASSPRFDINNSNTTHVLVSRRDRYITLHNALWDITGAEATNEPINVSTPLSSYKLIDLLTEAVIAPLSLAYSHNGTHFFAGARNKINVFDISYEDEPIHTVTTIPSARSKLKGGGRGFKGWISALTLSPPTTLASGGLLAAGARTRHVGIYDAVSGSEVTTFSLPGTVDGKKLVNANMQHLIGHGVSSLKFSPCGKYLYIAERVSDALLIYDLRNFALSLGYCAGRQALTKQKLGFDVWNAGASPYDIEATSHEIWAGGTDGVARIWRDPYMKEGAVAPDETLRVAEKDTPVVGTLVHPSGGLAVAACGFLGVGEDAGTAGVRRGGGVVPTLNEWGSVDVLQLS